MIFIRALLILIFLLITTGILLSAKGINSQDIEMLSIFILFILVLGPFWPTKDRQNKISAFVRRSNISKFVIYAFITSICFYFAADAYLHPDQSYSRGMKLIFEIFGTQGVIIFWLILSLDGVTRSYKAFKKMRSHAS